MRKKNKLVSIVVMALNLLFLTACEKSDSSTQPSTDTTLSTDNNQPSTNLVYNGNFEEGTGNPAGWTTKNQFLNDVTGWDTEVTHNSTHSLKIENIGGTDAYWQGQPIELKEPANYLDISFWSKTSDIKLPANGRYGIILETYSFNSEGKEVKQSVEVKIPLKDSDWSETKTRFVTLNNISKIVPYFYFSGILGNAWFDSLAVHSKSLNLKEGKRIFDSNSDNSFPKDIAFDSVSNSEKVYRVINSTPVYSSDFISVNEDAIYSVSGDFKTDGKPVRLLFGLACFNKDKKLIHPNNVNAIPGTDTILVKPCYKEDNSIYIENASNWIAKPNWPVDVVAFNVSKDLKDLPNYNISSPGINAVEKINDNCWKISLKNKVGKDYPEGTPVREHTSGYLGPFGGAFNQSLSDNWNKIEGIIAEKLFSNQWKLYSGTKYVKILIISNPEKPEDKTNVYYFKNIELNEINIK